MPAQIRSCSRAEWRRQRRSIWAARCGTPTRPLTRSAPRSACDLLRPTHFVDGQLTLVLDQLHAELLGPRALARDLEQADEQPGPQDSVDANPVEIGRVRLDGHLGVVVRSAEVARHA